MTFFLDYFVVRRDPIRIEGEMLTLYKHAQLLPVNKPQVSDMSPKLRRQTSGQTSAAKYAQSTWTLGAEPPSATVGARPPLKQRQAARHRRPNSRHWAAVRDSRRKAAVETKRQAARHRRPRQSAQGRRWNKKTPSKQSALSRRPQQSAQSRRATNKTSCSAAATFLTPSAWKVCQPRCVDICLQHPGAKGLSRWGPEASDLLPWKHLQANASTHWRTCCHPKLPWLAFPHFPAVSTEASSSSRKQPSSRRPCPELLASARIHDHSDGEVCGAGSSPSADTCFGSGRGTHRRPS